MSECLDDNTALALLDGKLPPARRAAVESHIESCAACRELVVTLTREGVVVDSQVGLQTEASEMRGMPIGRAAAGASAITAGPYVVEREVGSGAAGTVYRAVDERSGEVVALKLVTDPGWRSRFRREVETLSRLVHPGIVRYIAHGEARSGLYLAMEWLDGEDLAQRLERGPIPAADVRALGLRLTAALAHAHSVDAVHRDLGPRNVFLPGGRLEHAKLLDFGLVRVPDALDRTGSQAVLGTPQYMAPEQVKDPRNVDARSDIFSLGVVLFEALSGVRPFSAPDLFTLWNNIVGMPTPNLRPIAPNVPEAFVSLIERMLAKDPSQRPQTAAAVHEALVRIETPAAELGKSTTPMSPVGKAPIGKVTAPMSPIGQTSLATQAPVPVAQASTPSVSTPAVPAGKGTAPMTPRATALARSVSAPPPTPTPPATPRPKTNSAILIAAGLVAVAIVIAGAANVFGPRLLDRPGPAKSDDAAAISPTASTPPAPVASQPFACAGDAVEQRRGESYGSDAPQSAAVMVSANCNAVLEDCVIGGTLSILVNGKGELTLKNCKVTGQTQLVGGVTLTLQGTTLPSEPSITGKGRVVRR